MQQNNEKQSTGDEEGPKTKLDLDTILIEDIGQFGRYQFRILMLTFFLVVLTAFCAMEYMFTTARINTRCLIPECESLETAEFSPEWILNAVPASGQSFDNCLRFESANGTARSDQCPAEWFNRQVTVVCEDHVYEDTDTVVYDLELACDEWRRSFIGSVQTFGGLLALPITGFISDRWGRRTALSFNAFNAAWLGIARYWADTYYGFIISEGVEATFGGGSYSSAYVLMMELVGPKYRVAAGAILFTFFSFGQVVLSLIAWAVPYWRHLTLILYVPQLIFISYYWIMSESVRWYMSKGRFKDAEDFLHMVAKINKRQLSQKTLKALKQSAEENDAQKAAEENQKKNEPWLVVLVFRNKAILKRCCITPMWWVTGALIYYGMSVNSVNMSGNRYLNFMALAVSEIPGYWTAVLLMDRVGRKPVLISAYWVCAACQLAYIFIPDNMHAASLAMYLIGKFSIAIVMMSIYIFTAEVYPTRYRHSLLAFSSMIGRIGTIIAPLTPAFGALIWQHFPATLFGGFSFLSGLLVFLIPETLGIKLPDTMEEASALGSKKRVP